MKVIFGICLVVATMAGAAVLNFPKNELSQGEYLQGRIANGNTAVKGEAPYIVLFDNGTQYCAGSIIHPNWVVTAGHCVPYSKFDVVAGLHSRYDKSKAQIRKANVTNFIAHDEFEDFVNDLGLVYVSPAFDLHASEGAPVDKISLPSGNYSETVKAKVYGWGLLMNDSYPMELQVSDVDIVGYDACKHIFDTKHGGSPLHVSSICTYTEGSIKSTYRNDSGGPLVISTPAGPELVGVVSWGAPPKRKAPSVYTNISIFTDWISKTISNFTLINNILKGME